jgi:ribosomal protein S6--L-glutamate ligase
MTLHLCFLVEERRGEPGVGLVFTEVFEHLQGRGFNVDILIPEQTAWRADMLAPSHDLYLLKSDTELALTVAGILQAHEAPILNPYPNCLAAKDKIATARRLRAGRIPTPRSWAAADLGCLRPVIEEIPLIIRPYRGFHGCGAQKVADPHELATMPRFNAPVLAQEYIAGTGDDVKLYVVGDRVFSTRKPFSARSFTIPGRSCPVSAEMRDIALRCGEVFGLGLYGLDVIETREGPYLSTSTTSRGTRAFQGRHEPWPTTSRTTPRAGSGFPVPVPLSRSRPRNTPRFPNRQQEMTHDPR